MAVLYLNNNTLPRFFALSIAIHLLLLVSWPKSQVKVTSQDPISVTLQPALEPDRVKPTVIPKEAPTRPSRAKATIAQKSSPVLEERPITPKESIAQRKLNLVESSQRERAQEQPMIAERRLPTLKELLPPVTWSSSGQRSNRSDAPVALNTRNPQYVTYFGHIKRAIELVWNYPELALKYGLQGKLLMEFSILENGSLEQAKIVRSSGSSLLDEEALRAVKAAAPFSRIPPWIGKDRLDIVASFEYYDNRLDYRFSP
jgi:protein TonB